MVLQPGRDDVEVPGQVWIWELCVGEKRHGGRRNTRLQVSQGQTGMTRDEPFHTLSPCSLLRLPKGKWNSSNGVEEKETWAEEDELFDVQGKPEVLPGLVAPADV